MFLPLFSVFFTGTASSNTLLPRSIHTKREVTGSRSLRRYTCYSLKVCSMDSIAKFVWRRYTTLKKVIWGFPVRYTS